MNKETQDKKTGIEVLFEHMIKSSIFMTPNPKLRKGIYIALRKAVIDNRELGDDCYCILRQDLTPEETTAYGALKKMRLVDFNSGPCFVNPDGFYIYDSLEKAGVYDKLLK